MAKIALKVNVDTLHGIQEGVPNLAKALGRFDLKATFLFSLGDQTTLAGRLNAYFDQAF